MFYVVQEKPSGRQLDKYRTEFTYDDSVGRCDAEKCSECGAYISMMRRAPPFRVHIETWGRGYGDVAFWLDAFLVSARFRAVYKSAGLRGLSNFESVEVLSTKKHRKFEEPLPTYYRTIANLGSAKIDPLKSGIEWGKPDEPRCQRCLSGPGVLKRWKSVMIDESTWNGDDIFYAFGLPGSLIVSERFAKWAKGQEFRNLILVDSRSSSYDFYPMESKLRAK